MLARDVFLFDSFFFQAEDGIRDGHVTGVQTCALPIFMPFLTRLLIGFQEKPVSEQSRKKRHNNPCQHSDNRSVYEHAQERSEERRVGKECRSRWWPKH